MQIITCFKVVPEEQDITVTASGDLVFDRAKLTISNYDLNAIEAGAQLAEAHGAMMVGLSVGAANIDESKMKKNVLSRGPESLYLAADNSFADMDTCQTATVLKAAIEKIGAYDLVICGEGSSDIYAQQVGIQLGQLLNIPTINSISKITVEGKNVIVERSLEDEIEMLEIAMPAIISVTSDINLPRIPSMKQILAAGKKTSTVWTAAEIGLAQPERTIEILETKAPKQADRKQEVIEGDSDEAVQKLIEVISKELK
ncbi:putative electron transfer flavoprotein subunit (etfB-like) [uncultured Sporomusa sp.]|uniref:Electron transfer flavoprotein small subunit n=1 Tax=uncultured Sporomusa sp. TaxID=307249 RepID=A0A212LWL1_9FIRM|nr:electron transfer flavoprotein [uncultured Sporomusa sp.]SCM81912.1 putative electron transfer flavoprotein subunit (etfB-like) [uncultured Sporomusa sp.]